MYYIKLALNQLIVALQGQYTNLLHDVAEMSKLSREGGRCVAFTTTEYAS